MYVRFAKRRVEEALADTPVVLIVGPRRAGKTTLARMTAGDDRTYLTLDDRNVRTVARSNPTGFVRDMDRVIIDEIQRVPELLLDIKRSVDEDYRPGRFLLTGSANVMTLPRVADSLAGRIEIVRMLPLARAEIDDTFPTFLESLFVGTPATSVREAVLGDDLVRIALAGGFPEAIARESERRRLEWARSWLESVLNRDLAEIAEIHRRADLQKFVRLLAEHSGQLVNFSTLGSGIDVSYKTGQRYVELLEQLFLVRTLQPWYANTLKRISKRPKLHFLDSGLLAASRGMTFDRMKADRGPFGSLLECFVFSEILKLTTASDLHLTPYHFRDRQNREVDFVLERDDGRIAGIEVKSRASVRATDFAGLRVLAEACGKRFARGVVLYDGTDCMPFGDRLWAMPLSCLWG